MPDVVVPLAPAVVVACIALLVTVVCLWPRPQWLWCLPLAVTFAAAASAGIMKGPAPVGLLVLAVMLATYRRTGIPWIRICAAIVIAAVVLLLAVHAVPGFDNPLLIRDSVLSPDALPYRQYVNFDKTLAGVFVLASGVPLLRSRDQWLATLRAAAPVTLATLAVVLVGSLALGYVRFDPRWTPVFAIWAPINLLTTCVSEEAFFRAFLQREIAIALDGRPGGAAIAVAASALLFGLAHAAGGWRYVLLATLAGAGYAIAFQRTQRVEASILTHFAVNATHFLLFTYPALA
jgi:membrane protease YdiL (CAAX protease family)